MLHRLFQVQVSEQFQEAWAQQKVANKMKIALTVLVRDELDIIEKQIRFHRESGADIIIATDNGSVDGTRDILSDLSRQHIIDLILDEPAHTYQQASWVNRMGQLAKSCFKATKLIHTDADEFWYHPKGLRGFFIDAESKIVRVHAHNLLPIVNQQQFEDEAYCCIAPVEGVAHILLQTDWSKVCFDIEDGLIATTMGNHAGDSSMQVCVSKEGRIYHMPIRSKAQFYKKVINGGSALHSSNLSEFAGYHIRQWYSDYLDGTLNQAYEDLCFTKDACELLCSTGVAKRIQISKLEL